MNMQGMINVEVWRSRWLGTWRIRFIRCVLNRPFLYRTQSQVQFCMAVIKLNIVNGMLLANVSAL